MKTLLFRWSRWTAPAVLAVSAGSLSASAFAQDEAIDDESAAELSRIKVTGSRISRPVRDGEWKVAAQPEPGCRQPLQGSKAAS